MLNAGVDLGIDRVEHRRLQRRAAGGGAVGAHQRDVFVAQTLGKGNAFGGVADQNIGGAEFLPDVEHRHAAGQEGGHMEHRLHLRFDQAEGDDRGRMAVDDGIDVGPRPINLAMDEALDGSGGCVRVARVAVEAEFDDVAGRHQGRRQGARHQVTVRRIRMTVGHMAGAVDHLLIGQDPVGGGQVGQKRVRNRTAGGRCVAHILVFPVEPCCAAPSRRRLAVYASVEGESIKVE